MLENVLPYTPNLHSCVDMRLGENDMDWYGLLCSVHAGSLLLAPAVATAGQQTRLSAQSWATLMAGPFWGHGRAAGQRVTGLAARLAHHPGPGGGSM